ncbi:MAG TPA: Yip1 family protein [Pirellulales bacterium]|nr:Yip1 family protein [Pirellulales bacterium]
MPIPSGLDPNPYASPSPGAASFEFRGPSGPRSGPPWERDGASFNSFVATLKEFYGSANLFFDNMRREGGLGAPIGYLVAGGTVGGLGGFCLQIAIQMLLGMGMGNGPPFGPQMAGGAIGGAAGLVCVAIFLPLALIFGLFVTAGIYHLMLTMLGGARFPFETTVRVIAYSQGSTSLISLIPFCGGLINAIVNLVYTIVGLSRAHEISGGKAAAAVLIPFFICCGLGVALYAAIIFAVMNQANR